MSEIETYLKAKTEFEAMQGKLSSLSRLLTKVAQALEQQPGRMIFSNASPGLPMEASMSADSASFNANDWMSANQIQSLLAEWHAKKSAVMNAWAAIPPAMQSNLVPPNQPSRPNASRGRY